MIGQRIGFYEFSARLGEGGMGAVCRATDSRLEREVAIRVLPTAFTQDRERLVWVDRQGAKLGQLNDDQNGHDPRPSPPKAARSRSRSKRSVPPAEGSGSTAWHERLQQGPRR